MKKNFIIFHYLTSFVNDDEEGNGQRNNDKSKILKKRNPIFGFVISQDQKMDSFINNNKTKKQSFFASPIFKETLFWSCNFTKQKMYSFKEKNEKKSSFLRSSCFGLAN
jgi:hypothetical protein